MGSLKKNEDEKIVSRDATSSTDTTVLLLQMIQAMQEQAKTTQEQNRIALEQSQAQMKANQEANQAQIKALTDAIGKLGAPAIAIGDNRDAVAIVDKSEALAQLVHSKLDTFHYAPEDGS